MWRNNLWTKKTRWIVTAICGLILMGQLGGGSSNGPNPEEVLPNLVGSWTYQKAKVMGGMIINSKYELNIIKENIKDYVLNQTFNKSVKLDLGNSDLDLNVNIKDFMDEDKFKNKIDEILTPENVKSIISSILDCEKGNDAGNNFIAVLQ